MFPVANKVELFWNQKSRKLSFQRHIWYFSKAKACINGKKHKHTSIWMFFLCHSKVCVVHFSSLLSTGKVGHVSARTIRMVLKCAVIFKGCVNLHDNPGHKIINFMVLVWHQFSSLGCHMYWEGYYNGVSCGGIILWWLDCFLTCDYIVHWYV